MDCFQIGPRSKNADEHTRHQGLAREQNGANRYHMAPLQHRATTDYFGAYPTILKTTDSLDSLI